MGILKKAHDILSGWGNLALHQFDMLDVHIKEQAEERLNICDECPIRINNTCSTTNKGPAIKNFTYDSAVFTENRIEGTLYNGCGCNIYAKCCSPNVQCPLGKWDKMKLDGPKNRSENDQ